MACNNSATKTSDIEHAVWSHNYKVRFGSASSEASQSSGDICRICHCESDPQNPLLTPCYCSGSLKYVHQACLQQWLTASETNACELCKFPFIMHAKIKPFNEWRSLDISGIERRRLFCSVLFHCAAALCVIWSLCVLIERAADDVKNGLIDWPFWTKLAVVAVGLTGGIVFMYIQCKTYLHLCHRWKARNRILLIQNAPEKMNPVSQSLSPPTQQPSCRHYGTNETYNLCTNGGNLNATNDNVLYAINMPGGGYASTTAVADVTYNNRACMGHDHYETPSSHHHHNMMQHSDVDVDSVASLTSARISKSHGKRNFLHQQQAVHHHQNQMLDPQMHSQFQLGQVAVAANIEYSQQQNYERDFALDDVISQLSSFQPCPQGSGSMTPFHDSIHNVLEHSEDSSRISANDFCVGSRQNLSAGGLSTDTGQDNALQLSSLSGSGDHKAPSISSGVSHAVANGLGGFVYKPHVKLYSNSSIFLENHDLLNDSATMDLEVNSASSNERTNYLHVNMLSPDGEHNKLEQFLDKDMRRNSDTKLLNEYLIQNICCQVPATGHLRQSMQNVNEKESPTETKADDKSTQPRAKSCIQFNSLPNLTSSCENLINE